MQVSILFREMRHIKQDQKSVTEYAGELKKLYRDLEFFRPFKPHDPIALLLLREWFEPLLVEVFLEGLNEEFKLRSEMISTSPDWPTLDQTITSILEEETRLASKDSTAQLHGDNRAALTLTRTSTVPNSDQANATRFDHKKRSRVGHLRKDWFDLVGYPPGWHKRQSNKYYMANNHKKKQDMAHFTSSAEELSPVALQALEEFKAKLMSASEKGPHEASTSSGKEGDNHLNTPWIIDSGATNHMTGSPRIWSRKDTWDWN
uniref:Uncharacterized protein n=1 Tax=Avena sativa TaxID=4498 RepID=A0ACD5Y3R9_AVESA